jgi:hypothetical protein
VKEPHLVAGRPTVLAGFRNEKDNSTDGDDYEPLQSNK